MDMSDKRIPENPTSRHPLSRRRLLLGGGSLFGTACVAASGVVILGGCNSLPMSASNSGQRVAAADSALIAAPPRVRNRDRWRYEITNLYNRESLGQLNAEVVEVGNQLRITNTHSNERSLADEIYTGAWNVVQETHYDAPIVFDQPVPVLPGRLEPGASERVRASYHPLVGERQFFWSLYLDARAWERIRVPAGEFDALRIDRRIWFSHFDPFRLGSERYETLWYAPAVNRWVQREWTGSYVVPGGRRGTRYREDWVRWQLLDYVPAPVQRS